MSYIFAKNIVIGLSIALNVYLLFYINAYNETNRINVEQKEVEIKDSIEEFYKIALNSKTDKVTTHSYHYVYGTYLPRFRKKHVNFLEIGLGCGMGYGPGKSVDLWKAYFPDMTLQIMEYNKDCAEAFRSKVDKLYIGDQSDPKTLNSIGAEGGPFDVIVDDGGHSRKQQLTSLIELWKYVKPNGGIYVMEDIITAFMTWFNDSEESPYNFVVDNLRMFYDPSYIGPDYKSMYEIPKNQTVVDFHKSLMSMDCYRGACVFVKK
jgi:hypothetical protein